MITKEEKHKIDDLFHNLEIKIKNDIHPNSYWINKYKNIRTVCTANSYSFRITDGSFDKNHIPIFLYKTKKCDTFEEFFDELIIFKELILPKYL